MTDKTPYPDSLERRIVRAAIHEFIGAGFRLDVNDGEETTLRDSTNGQTILAAMFSTDEDYLIVRKDGKHVGWVRFIYGNGCDVISDYTMSVESFLTEANAISNQYA